MTDAIPSLTLPIDSRDGLALDPAAARALGEGVAPSYQSAAPFPHIVLDDFLPQSLAQMLVDQFPAESHDTDVVFDRGYLGHHKRAIHPEACPAAPRELFLFLNSGPVLQFLEAMTGIDGLIADPYFNGGGFHEIGSGGKLGIHADFRINEKLHLNRRLNLLIYLNPGWDEAWGGRLELWDRPMKACARSVLPLFNRCVVFSTDADSWHGHPDPLGTPPGVVRRSLALYYYTASQAVYRETPGNSTMYVARPHDPAAIKAEALRLRSDNYLRDWLPPAVYRGINRLGNALAKKKG